MGKTSCVAHPPGNRLLLIREWQMRLCDGNHCAAALLSFMEFKHNAIIDSEKSKDIIQYHKATTLSEGMFELYGKGAIKKARELLVKKKLIRQITSSESHRNDQTIGYIFLPEVLNNWIDSHYRDPESGAWKSEMPKSATRNRDAEIGNSNAEIGNCSDAEIGNCKDKEQKEPIQEIIISDPSSKAEPENPYDGMDVIPAMERIHHDKCKAFGLTGRWKPIRGEAAEKVEIGARVHSREEYLRMFEEFLHDNPSGAVTTFVWRMAQGNGRVKAKFSTPKDTDQRNGRYHKPKAVDLVEFAKNLTLEP